MQQSGSLAGTCRDCPNHPPRLSHSVQVPILLGNEDCASLIPIIAPNSGESITLSKSTRIYADTQVHQGSAFVYKSYLEPFFRKHEAEIDAGVVAAQTNTVAFAQAKLTALWETGWRIATRSQVPAGASTSSQPNSQGPPPPSAQPPNPAHLFAMGANFVQSYGQGAFGAIQRSLYAGAPQSAPTATGPSPRPSPGVQQRTPFYASSENVSRASSSHSNTQPAFPEPYHF